jgi:hypothetical protein
MPHTPPPDAPRSAGRSRSRFGAPRWEARRQLLIDTLTRCGLTPTDADHQAAEALADNPPETVRVVAGWIARTAAAQRPTLADLHTHDTQDPNCSRDAEGTW